MHPSLHETNLEGSNHKQEHDHRIALKELTKHTAAEQKHRVNNRSDRQQVEALKIE